MNPERVIGDLGFRPVHTAPANALVGDVLASYRADWIVIVGRSEPIAAVARAELERSNASVRLGDLLGLLPPVLVIDAAVSLVFAQIQAQRLELGADGRVVVMGDGRAIGVLSGRDLAAMGTGAEYRSADLPGPIRYPGKISRSCRYSKRRKTCGVRRVFDRKPSTMPPCLDPKQLGPHQFGW